MPRDDIAACMEPVARRLLGEPNKAMSKPDELRFGSRGSMQVFVNKGTWWSHEDGVGGGVLDLIERETGHANGAAVEWLLAEGILADNPQPETAQRRIVATYDYRDEAGTLLYQVCRFEPKDFRQRRPDGHGGWDWSVKGVRRVPYRLRDVLKAGDVFVVEGEKDADRLAVEGFQATCNAGGANKWSPALNPFFAGKNVYVVPDNDDPGSAHAQQVAAALHSVASSVRVITIPHGKDVSDWLDAGGTRDALIRIATEAPLWAPPADEDAPSGPWGSIAPEGAASFLAKPIPPRQWLLGTVACRTFVTVLAATGGAGKTTLLIAKALSMATGRPLLGWRVHKRARVLVCAFEDDADELRRRLMAACLHYAVTPADLDGWLCLACVNRSGVHLMMMDAAGNVQTTDAESGLVTLCQRLDIAAITFDPWVKFSGVPENDNGATDAAMNVLSRVADRANVAIIVAHHTRKGPADAGNMDSTRGARALVDAARIGLTLTPMTPDEARRFDICEDDRRQFIRVDDGKANLAPMAAKAQWFRLVSVPLLNGTDAYPNGDNVQAIETWAPPETWAGLPDELLNRILDDIDAGLPDGERFTTGAPAGDREAWRTVKRHAPDKTDGQCRDVIRTWVKTGLLLVKDYHSETARKDRKGLSVDPTKRPGNVRH